MLVVQRKNLVIGMLVVLLVITGYLNYVYNQNIPQGGNKDLLYNDKDNEKPIITVGDIPKNDGSGSENGNKTESTSDVVSTSSSSNFFIEYRFERENIRKKEVEYIREIVDNPQSDPEIKKEAQAQLLELTTNMEKELGIEGLLKAKGFKDAIVILHQDLVNVIVGKKELAPEEVAQILDIVKRESGKAADNIKIIPTSH